MAYKATMKAEGSYANNPNDKGGETYAGISRKNWPWWGGWMTIDNMRKTPNFPECIDQIGSLQVLVQDFYRVNFWNVLKLDQFTQPIATELFDLGVNCGTGVAGQFLQRSLNCLNNNATLFPDLTVDGSIGAATLAAFAKCRDTDVLACIVALQGAKYISICENNHSQEEFMKGWIRRAFSRYSLLS